MKHFVRTIALVCAAAIAGCGGGSHTAPSLGATNASSSSALVSAPFSVTAGTTDVTHLGITSSAAPGSAEQSIAVTAGTTTTASLMLPSGAQTLTIKAYGSKTTVSTLRTTVGSSRVTLAVGTAVAQVSLDLAATALAGSGSGTTTLYVTARDANGNSIVGALASSVTLTSSDTTGAVTLSATTVSTGSAAVTVSYNGSGSIGTVTFTASVSGLSASAFTSATLSFTAAQLMYLANNTSVLVFPAGATGNPAPLQKIILSPTQQGVGATVADASGNLWLELFGTEVMIIPSTANGITTTQKVVPASTFPAGQVPEDLGTDGAGNIYVLSAPLNQSGGAAVTVFPSGSMTPSRVITGSSTTLGNAPVDGIGVGADGTIAVLTTDPTVSYGEVIVFAPGANGNVAPTRVITGANTTLNAFGVEFGASAVGLGPDDSIAVNDVSSNGVGAVDVFAPSATGNVAPARRISGSATGLDASGLLYTIYGTGGTGKLNSQDGIGVDGQGRIYVSEIGSQSGVVSQLARFDLTANGNVPPNGLLGGVLTGITSPGYVKFSNAVVAPPPVTAPSVSGDFLALSPNRGWNYTMQALSPLFTAAPAPFTLTLYTDPTLVGSDTQLVALQESGTDADATGGSVVASATFNQSAAGYTATSYTSVSNNIGPLPILGGMLIVPPTLTLGQTFVPFVGITGTVTAIGPVAGSAACPGGAATGATVQYSFGNTAETITYVPGCGITSFISDEGMIATLTSIGSYPSLGQLAHARVSASEDRLTQLHSLWRNVFKPWSAK